VGLVLWRQICAKSLKLGRFLGPFALTQGYQRL